MGDCDPRRARRFCNCSAHCGALGKHVSVTTHNRHAQARNRDLFGPSLNAVLASLARERRLAGGTEANGRRGIPCTRGATTPVTHKKRRSDTTSHSKIPLVGDRVLGSSVIGRPKDVVNPLAANVVLDSPQTTHSAQASIDTIAGGALYANHKPTFQTACSTSISAKSTDPLADITRPAAPIWASLVSVTSPLSTSPLSTNATLVDPSVPTGSQLPRSSVALTNASASTRVSAKIRAVDQPFEDEKLVKPTARCVFQVL